ncbi:hypothetical protein ACFL2O_05050 [Thermodesulfobacteriota bacterium]
MSKVLTFSRNRSTSVLQVDAQILKASCRLNDTLTEAYVEILVTLPELEIVSINGEVDRTYLKECSEPVDALQKVVGVRVGPGVLKIIKGLIGESTKCRQLAFMVEECCHGIILSLTKDEIGRAPTESEKAKEYFKGLVRENIRLYNRCAAFAPGSPIVEGIEPPDKD